MRVKDVDFGRNQIAVRRGKCDKDRVTMLPGSVKRELAEHVERVRVQHARGSAADAGLGRAARHAVEEAPLRRRPRVALAVGIPRDAHVRPW